MMKTKLNKIYDILVERNYNKPKLLKFYDFLLIK
jgi:hypothetical protein